MISVPRIKDISLGFISCALIGAFIVAPLIWPPELSLVFNQLFWLSAAMVGLCAYIVAYLYKTNGGSSRQARFALGLCLILAASCVFSGFEQIARNTEFWRPHFPHGFQSLFLVLDQFIVYTKNIVAFGFAAIGASVTANTMHEAKLSSPAALAPVTKPRRVVP